MTGIIHQLRHAAMTNRKRILLPESADPRVMQAAAELAAQNIVQTVFITLPDGVLTAPKGVEVFSELSDANDWRERAAAALTEFRAAKGMTLDKARVALENPLLLAALLVRLGYADGCVAGSIATTADVLRAGIQGLGLAKGAKQVSSIFIMELRDGRLLSFGDCAVNPDPDSVALADIAICSAKSHELLTGQTPSVALLSFSTRGSAEHPNVEKVRAALGHVQVACPELAVDGEMQFDAALVPEIAQKKAPNSVVAGRANVFIFPDLNAGNIGYKIAERIGGAKAIGPVLQGFAKPWMDLSRGCSAEDIANVAVIAAVLAK